MPKPNDVYILIEEVELEEERGNFILSEVDKEVLKLMKLKADNGINLTGPQWDRAVSLYLRSKGRSITE